MIAAPPARRSFPWLAAALVALAVAAMIGLGIWQLSRARWKEGMLARFAAARTLPPVAFPTVPTGDDTLLFRRATGFCLEPAGWRVAAGANRAGQSGWRYLAACRTGAEGPGLTVDAGWSPSFDLKPGWRGGPVTGTIGSAPNGRSVFATLLGPSRPSDLVLVAERAAPGLQPSAPPSPADIPNNHRFYAIQWFAFAAIASAIFAVALRRKLRPGG